MVWFGVLLAENEFDDILGDDDDDNEVGGDIIAGTGVNTTVDIAVIGVPDDVEFTQQSSGIRQQLFCLETNTELIAIVVNDASFAVSTLTYKHREVYVGRATNDIQVVTGRRNPFIHLTQLKTDDVARDGEHCSGRYGDKAIDIIDSY